MVKRKRDERKAKELRKDMCGGEDGRNGESRSKRNEKNRKRK